MEWLKRFRSATSRKLPHDFQVGQILKMSPGYHTKNPYYVEVVEVSKSGITTNIPGRHKCLIPYPSQEWNYHASRMEFVGMKETKEHLLLNQKLD